MREFYIIKKNGVGMIIDAIDEADALFRARTDAFSIEESRESIEKNMGSICKKPRMYEIQAPKSSLEQRVDKLIIAVNQNNNISVWEKQFIYEVKRNLKAGHKLSMLQLEKFEQICGRVMR